MTIEASDLVAKANPHIRTLKAALACAHEACAAHPEINAHVQTIHDAANGALADLKALVGDATDPNGAQLDDGGKPA